MSEPYGSVRNILPKWHDLIGSLLNLYFCFLLRYSKVYPFRDQRKFMEYRRNETTDKPVKVVLADLAL